MLTLLSSNFLLAQNEVNLISNNTYQPVGNQFLSPDITIIPEIPEPKKITYDDHLNEAKSFEIPLIENFDQMDSLILSNHLIAVIEESDFFKIQKLTHSRAYLNSSANAILLEIAEKFNKETQYSLSISSLTRTIETQNKLRRVNSNAAKGDSSHAYGASFDISYTQYGDKKGRNYANERVLESLLNEMVDEGKIYYIKERKQPCYHITVRNTKKLGFNIS